VAAGDIDGDGFDEIVTGAGPGAVYGPHVRGWNVDGAATEAIEDLSWFAYGTHHYGVNVACGDVDGDGVDEIITAPGPSPNFSSHIRGWDVDDGQPVPMQGINFFAWYHQWAGMGARVHAGADLDDDGRTELVVGIGPDLRRPGIVNVYNYDEQTVSVWIEFEVDDRHTSGVNVTAGWLAVTNSPLW